MQTELIIKLIIATNIASLKEISSGLKNLGIDSIINNIPLIKRKIELVKPAKADIFSEIFSPFSLFLIFLIIRNIPKITAIKGNIGEMHGKQEKTGFESVPLFLRQRDIFGKK